MDKPDHSEYTGTYVQNVHILLRQENFSHPDEIKATTISLGRLTHTDEHRHFFWGLIAMKKIYFG